MTNLNLAKLIRRIQELTNKEEQTPQDIQELDFYEAVKSAAIKVFVPGCHDTIVSICLRSCPLERAQELARTLGLHVVQGGTAVYLDWSKGLDDE